MKKFSFTKKVSLFLAALAVCIIAACTSMPVQAAGPVLAQYDATTSQVAFTSDTHLGNSIQVEYSATPSFNTGVSKVTATYYNPVSGKYIYVLNKTFTAASLGYIRYNGTVLPIVTAPNAITTIKQSNANSSSVTASWTASAGATGYLVYVGTSKDQSTWSLYTTVTGTSCQINNLKAATIYYVAAFPYKDNGQGFKAAGDGRGMEMLSTSGKVKGLKYSDQVSKQNYYEVSWTSAGTVDGYEVWVYNRKGKKVATFTTNGATKCGMQTSKLKNVAFKFKVRSYVQLDAQGNKAYSAWSATKVVVPYARITKTSALGSQKVKVKWSKVTGATSYTIYKCSTATGKYKKVATVKGTSYTVSNVPYNKYTYFCVKANKVKVGSKKYNTTTLKEPDWYRVYLYKYYY